ncbi:hypothetical protein ACH4TE_14255 [Streptomyces sioyaensis]|uniref:hypothetical protein n=1 Tax=Streptomyces sioyaensis TaxID=67364 RepID=UPI00379AF25C
MVRCTDSDHWYRRHDSDKLRHLDRMPLLSTLTGAVIGIAATAQMRHLMRADLGIGPLGIE